MPMAIVCFPYLGMSKYGKQNRANDMLREDKVIEVLDHCAYSFRSNARTASVSEKRQLLEAMMRACKCVDGELPEGTAGMCQLLFDDALASPSPEHPLIQAFLYLMYYELTDSQAYLHKADLILNSMSNNDQDSLDLESKDFVVQLKRDIITAQSLILIDRALILLEEESHRRLRDFIMDELPSLPIESPNYTKDALLDILWKSLNQANLDLFPITKRETDFIIAFAKSKDEHLYHQAIGMYCAFVLGVRLGNPVPNRLYSCLRKFKSIPEQDLKNLVWCQSTIAPIDAALRDKQAGWYTYIRNEITDRLGLGAKQKVK
ncbi:UNVERIFIED_CONTAM: hypothetical protein HDU68_007929 [Siphonaria sp. JEL0065]|nr:hypothetical protein HDU68_007929 [Siphonaria sp. JEL0065]